MRCQLTEGIMRVSAYLWEKIMTTYTIPAATRPDLEHYGVPKETDGLLEWAWVDEQIGKSRNYWICSTRPDGRPHAVPVWGVWVDGTVYFGGHRQARRSQNLAHNPAVVVHLESGDDAVMIEGQVVEFDPQNKDLLKRIYQAYRDKYPPYDPSEESLEASTTIYYGVTPRKVMAWKETEFIKTPTRWVFE